METKNVNPGLRVIQQASMKDKVVLVRVDHNVVKKGGIKDPYRIDVTFKTIYSIAEKGGRPILMTHVGRPRDKKTGQIQCKEEEAIGPIVRYLEQKLPIKILSPQFPADPGQGIARLENDLKEEIPMLKSGEIGMIYLPNIRWFQGEQATESGRETLATWLSGLADLYVNDAFSSWRPHCSTYDIAKKLPAYAGFQIQEELSNLHRVLNPQKPFVAVVAGAKYDTKIGPLKALYKKADHIILGGIIFNVYLAAKYGVKIEGVSEEERDGAMELVELDKNEGKIISLPFLTESKNLKERVEGQFRTVHVNKMKKGDEFDYLLDIDPMSLEDEKIKDIISSAKTIFVNAVMGLTPTFPEGTRALYRLIASNREAMKLFGGGDTLQELRNLCPGIYLQGLDAPDYYYFTGGGSVLTTLEKGNPYELQPIKALME